MPCCSLGFLALLRLGSWGLRFSVPCCLYSVLLKPCDFLSAILPPMVYIPMFRCLPSLATVSSVPVRSYFFLFVWALGRLAWFPCSASPSLVNIPLSFLQVVTSFPSLGALLTLSNLRYTTRRGLTLGRVSYWLTSWRFIVVPIPHGSPLLLVALLLITPRSCAGFSWHLISCWVPSLSLGLLPVVFSAC